MRFLLLILVSIFMAACTVAPKGDYTRTKIDRPYVVPDDIALTSISVGSWSQEIGSAEDSATGEIESETQSTSGLLFEQGLGDNLSWLYPIGLKFNPYAEGDHTIGLEGVYLFLFNSYSIDYWYRLNEQVSIRPYKRGYNFDLLLFKQSEDLFGSEILWQQSKYLAFSLFLEKGTIVSSSELVEIILEGVSDSDVDTETEGDVMYYGFNVHHSLSESWDVELEIALAKYTYDTFELEGQRGDLTFTYIW